MNKYGKIYIAGMAMAIPPWGMILKPAGIAIQASATGVQLIGLVMLIWLLASKKSIW